MNKKESRLATLKKRYISNYIDPLISISPKRLTNFDDFCIRIKDQIEEQYEKVENASVCKCCSGRGFTGKKNPHSKYKINFKNYFFEQDQRAVDIKMCQQCFGTGLSFKTTLNKIGDVIPIDRKIHCPECKKELKKQATESIEKGYAYCISCGVHVTLSPIGYEITKISK